MNRAEQDGQAKGKRQQRQACDRHMDGEDERHCLADIVVDASPEPHRLNDRPEIIVEKHDRRRFAGDIGATLAHGNADMRRLERRGIVDSVSRHCDDFAIRLIGSHDPQLLLRHDPREDGHRLEPFCQRRIVQGREFAAGQHVAARDPRLGRDRLCGRRIVARDHYDLDPGAPAFGDGGRDADAQGIGEADQADQGKIMFLLGFRQAIASGDRCRCDTQHAQSLLGHGIDGIFQARALARR